MTPDLAFGASDEIKAWDDQNVRESLARAVMRAAAHATSASSWYAGAKWSKRLGARAFRAASIVLAAVAGVLPMLSQLEGLKATPSILPSILLTPAAALIAFDRFFGCSTSWMRFTATEMRLLQSRQEFLFEWEAEQASWPGGAPSPDAVARTLSRCKAFVVAVNTAVLDETSSWVAEFQDTLKSLDETVRASAAAASTGGIVVTVTNGDASDGGAWTLSLDDGSPQSRSGRTAALVGLAPGMHRIRVEGRIGTERRQAEAALVVAAGTIGSVQMTLS